MNIEDEKLKKIIVWARDLAPYAEIFDLIELLRILEVEFIEKDTIEYISKILDQLREID